MNYIALGLILIALVLLIWGIVRFSKLGIIQKLIASFDNTTNGFSARKLSAFAGVTVSIVATFRFVDDKTIIEALMVWLVFALLCLGIVTAEQVLKFYKGGDTQKEVEKLEDKTGIDQTEVEEKLPKV